MENIVSKYPSFPIKLLNAGQIYQKIPFLMLIILIVAGIFYDSWYLFASPSSVGIDGYYYTIQVNSFFQKGAFYFPTGTPLILILMVFVKCFVGNTIISIKIVSLSLQALLSLGVFLTVKKITNNAWLGIISSILVSFAGLHFYYTSEFIKNLGANVFIIWGTFFFSRWRKKRNSSVNLLLTASCLTGACLSHKSAVFIIFTFSLLGIISYLLLRKSTSGKYKILLIGGLGLTFVTPLILLTQSIIKLPKGLSDEISYAPHLPLGDIATPEKISLLVISPLLLFLIWQHQSNKKNNFDICFFLTINLWTILITLNPFLNHQNNIVGVTVRLDSLSYIQVALLFSGILWLSYDNHIKSVLLMLLIIPSLLCGFFSQLPYGLRSNFLDNQLQLSKNLPFYKEAIEAESVVIAAHGDQFLVTSVLEVQSRQNFDKSLLTRRIYWLITGLKGDEVRGSFPLAVSENNLYTVMLSNNELVSLLRKISVKDKRRLLWKNLHLRNICLGEVGVTTQCDDIGV